MGSTLVPIVEGQSEQRALGLLLRRMIAARGRFDVEVARPFRVKRTRVVRDGEIEKAVGQAVRSRAGATMVLVVLDADTDCPARIGPALLERCRTATDLPIAVVLPTIEIEAWILAAVESVQGRRGLRSDARAPDGCEAIRDAKGALSHLMEHPGGYVATADLPSLLDGIDIEMAASRSPSFAKLGRDLDRLLAAG